MSTTIEPSKLFADFAELGKRFYNIGIIYLVGIVGGFIPLMGTYITLAANIAQFIFVYLAAMQIKGIYNQVNSAELNACYKFLIIGMALTLTSVVTGMFITDAIASELLIILENPSLTMEQLIATMIPLIYLGIITWIGAIFEFMAWRKFEVFWLQNIRIFPENIGPIVAKAIRNLKNAAFMTILSFLIVTILIGVILYLLGYFTLGDTLKKLDASYLQNTQGPTNGNQLYEYRDITNDNRNNMPIQNAGFQPQLNFCSKCGTKLLENAKFCPACGSVVTNKYQ
jgi:hypothetical protein